MPDDVIIGTLGGRSDGQEQVYRSEGRGHEINIPLIVVMDRKTSGAEVFAAAPGDNKRALLVGEKTAGLTDISTQYTLRNGALLRIRTARAYRPSGAEIDGNGVKPGKEVVLTEETRAAIYDKMETAPEGYHGDDERDIQIKTAVDILTGGLGLL